MFKHIIGLLVAPALLNAQLTSLAENWKTDKDLRGASYGYCVVNCKTNDIVAAFNAHELVVPASTLKIVSTSAALTLLGSGFKYETKISYTGTFNKENGILDGDLIIVGSGDPSLQSEYFTKENVMNTWAKAIKQAGVKQVKGKIIGDASVYEKSVPGEWIWNDIGNYFGAPACGLSFMDNKFKLFYNSGAAGSEAKLVGTNPNYKTNKYDITSSVKSQGREDEAYVYGDPYSFTKDVKGTIPPNKLNYEVEAALPDPALLCAEALLQALEKEGIVCLKKQAISNYKKDAFTVNKKPLYTHYSPTLDKLIFYTNLKSNNQYCESFVKALGKGSALEGLEAVKSFCRERGLATDELFMVDACGLSRSNTTTVSFLTTLLAKMSKDSLSYRILKNSFPVAGKNGSMANIGKGSYIENNMHAKTGYINRVRAYSGYVKSKSGKELAFAVILNNYTCNAREAKLKLEKFLIELGEL